jgi:selenocysteine-specific elongation factor
MSIVDFENLSVGILSGDKEVKDKIAKTWGKKGSSTDITLYSISKPLNQTTVVPETYPNKIQSLVYTAHMSDVVVIPVPTNGLDASLGESVLLADTLQLPAICCIVSSQAAALDHLFDQMNKMFSNTSIKDYPKVKIDDQSIGNLRGEVLELFKNKVKHSETSSPVIIEVDHAFPVQGVGSVILGTTIQGVVKKGQKIIVYPGKFTGVVKSIQVNDENVNEAKTGTHVGIALRGILDKNIERGSILTDEVTNVIELLKIENVNIRLAAFTQPIKEGQILHGVFGLSDVPLTVIKWEKIGDRNVLASFNLQKPAPYYENMAITILDLNAKQRIVGSKDSNGCI